MKLATLYKDLRIKKIKPHNYSQLWQEWLWGMDCTAAVEEACGDMNAMHVNGLLLSFYEALDEEEAFLHLLVPSVPLVHLYRSIQLFLKQ